MTPGAPGRATHAVLAQWLVPVAAAVCALWLIGAAPLAHAQATVSAPPAPAPGDQPAAQGAAPVDAAKAAADSAAAEKAAADKVAADKAAAEAQDEAEEKAPLKPCPVVRPSPTAAPLPPIEAATAAFLRDRVHRRLGGVVSSVCRTPFALYEVIVDGDVLYVDERANYLLTGNAIDLRTKENLTATRSDEVLRVDIHKLPLDLAVKTVRGNGARQLVIFEDPNCPYCKRLEKEIAGLKDTTIYTFLFPILSRNPSSPEDSYAKARAIWCAADRATAWEQTMVEGKRIAAAPKDCPHPLEQILALGQRLHVTGTPTLIFPDGRRAPGVIPMDKIEQMLAQGAPAPVPR